MNLQLERQVYIVRLSHRCHLSNQTWFQREIKDSGGFSERSAKQVKADGWFPPANDGL